MAVGVDDEGRARSGAFELARAGGRRDAVLEGWDRRRAARLLGELGLMLFPLAPYQLLTLIPVAAGPAVAHGRQILALEQSWGVAVEHGLFEVASGRPSLFAAAHAYYLVGHFSAVVVAALVLAYVAPDRWVVMRTAFVLTTLVGLVIFRLYPTAPPNLLPGSVFATEPTHNPPDPFGAMPSEHIAWTVWALVAVVVASRTLWRNATADQPTGNARGAAVVAMVLAGTHLVLMVLVVLATAHHYVLDVLAGAVLLGVGLALAAAVHNLLRRRRRGRSARCQAASAA